MCQQGRGDGGVGLEREGCTLGFTPDWDGTMGYKGNFAAHHQDMLFASDSGKREYNP